MDIIHELTNLSEDDIRAFQKNARENGHENSREKVLDIYLFFDNTGSQ